MVKLHYARYHSVRVQHKHTINERSLRKCMTLNRRHGPIMSSSSKPAFGLVDGWQKMMQGVPWVSQYFTEHPLIRWIADLSKCRVSLWQETPFIALFSTPSSLLRPCASSRPHHAWEAYVSLNYYYYFLFFWISAGNGRIWRKSEKRGFLDGQKQANMAIFVARPQVSLAISQGSIIFFLLEDMSVMCLFLLTNYVGLKD